MMAGETLAAFGVRDALPLESGSRFVRFMVSTTRFRTLIRGATNGMRLATSVGF
jgi:hypothetical protein